MKKLIFSVHVSLDGFVAGSGGEMDWIQVDEEVFSLTGQLTEAADVALYGRVTFEMMEAYWPTADQQPAATKHDIEHARWYNRVPKIVLSRTRPDSRERNVRVVRDNLSVEINKAKRAPGKNILIFGSPAAIQSLLKEKLVDEFWLFINPVILIDGIPLFDGITERISLGLVESKRFSSGVTAVHCRIKN